MNIEFTRKNKKLQFILLFACGIFAYFVYYRVIVQQDFLSQSSTYIVISIIILATIFIFLLIALVDLNKKIIITNTAVIIKNPLKTYEIIWQDILEFKKQEKGFGVWAGWKYSLKYNENNEKQIMLTDENIENLQELIKYVFKYAVKAKFVEIRNDSSLPFLKNYIISEWKKE
jgi:hypothetical protein